MIQPSTDAIVQEIDYPHPIERVWEALTDPSAVSEWLMKADGLKAEAGSKFTLTMEGGEGWSGVVECQVLEADEPSHLRYTWVSPPAPDLTVNFNLEPRGDGTHLRLELTGFDAGDPSQTQFRTGADYGWSKKFLPELGTLLEKRAARA
jgi:uncharacterized protein YndB with AHSA1/START domain